MKILFISTLCSDRLIQKMLKEEATKPAQSMQKFMRLLAVGFIKNHASVDTISVVPVNLDSKKKIVCYKNEVEEEIQYKYIPFVNIKVLNNISVLFASFLMTLVWCAKNRKEKRVVCFDVLKVTVSLGSLLACKLVRQDTMAIVTDIPGFMVGGKRNFYSKLASRVNRLFINSFDKYILLTEQMNELMNIKKRPYIVMEGLVDINEADNGNDEYLNQRENKIRKLLYAGGIYKKYGLEMLVKAFINTPFDDAQLHLYGHGDMIDDLQEYQAQDSRIVYQGVVRNSDVVKAQKAATLLINPRPSTLELAKYSFPSKNMEYMVSGTPVLTAKLPGMPLEYHDYIYLIEEESIEGITEALTKILNKPESELRELGRKAKDFVLKEKSNVYQTQRIIEFMQ